MTEASPKPAAAKDDRKRIQKRILDAVNCEIEGPVVERSYVLAIFAVACGMLLLPAAYLGLIALIGYTIWWHAAHLGAHAANGRPFTFEHVWDLLPLLVGPIAILFAIKPFFARNIRSAAPERLKREVEPFLFEYVDAVADAVSAPRPTSIRIDTEANASAGLRRGMASFFTNDLTLTIGLPLVQGLTVRELTGVIAHEFGHFSQTAGMRLGYVIRVTSMWLVRVTFERDAWDAWLIETGDRVGWPFKVVFLVARFFIYLTRVALYGLTWLGNAISCYLMRQQEYDADLYETRLVGSPTFVRTSRKLQDLGLAHHMAVDDLQRFWEDGRLANDLPAVVAANLANITPKIRTALRKHRRQAETGLFDSHPSDADRIARSREETESAAFLFDGTPDDYPATILFQDFGRLSRAASSKFYKSVLEEEFDEKRLCPAKRLIQENSHETQAFRALDRFFQTRIPLMRPLSIDPAAETKPRDSQHAAELAASLKGARKRMLELLPRYKKLVDRHDHAEGAVFSTAAAQMLLDCGLSIRHRSFRLPNGRRRTIDEKLERSRKGLQQIAASLFEYESEAATRLSCAMQLIQMDAVAKRIPNGDALRREVGESIPNTRFVGNAMANLLPMGILYHRLFVLTSSMNRNETRRDLIEKIFSTMEKLSALLNQTSKSLGNRQYPFEHGSAAMTIREYALPTVPEDDDFWGMVSATDHLMQKLCTLQVRLFARIANAVEQVETAIGLPLLPDPKDDDDSEDA
jgi:Zn-dependent protease with chaperone function